MAILGGIGGLAGPVLGSFIITVLPEMLRASRISAWSSTE